MPAHVIVISITLFTTYFPCKTIGGTSL